MAKKSNLRSFRYSDEVAAILINYGSATSSLNDKFEQLVLDCNMRVPEIEKQIKFYNNELDKLRKECAEVQAKIYDQRAIGRELDMLMSSCGKMRMRITEAASKLENL